VQIVAAFLFKKKKIGKQKICGFCLFVSKRDKREKCFVVAPKKKDNSS
jgi:hypothetical protein